MEGNHRDVLADPGALDHFDQPQPFVPVVRAEEPLEESEHVVRADEGSRVARGGSERRDDEAGRVRQVGTPGVDPTRGSRLDLSRVAVYRKRDDRDLRLEL